MYSKTTHYKTGFNRSHGPVDMQTKTTSVIISNEPCLQCGKMPIYIKSVGLCLSCYHHMRYIKINKRIKKHFMAEEKFLVEYGNSSKLIYEPCVFKFKGLKYRPDFYDPDTNEFIEIVGTRQRWHQNRDKLQSFQETFPKIKLKIYHMGFTPRSSNNHQLMCLRCFHKWIPRQGEVRQCPQCKSVWWDTPKIKEYELKD